MCHQKTDWEDMVESVGKKKERREEETVSAVKPKVWKVESDEDDSDF